jgi:hypothetical protein
MYKFVAVLFLAVISPLTALATPITYSVIPAALDNNLNLTGSITTDGTIGTLAVGNFVSWSLHMQQTVAPFQSYAASGVLPRSLSGPVTATSTSFSMPWAEPPIDSNSTSGSILRLGDLNFQPISAEFRAITYLASVSEEGTIPGWYSAIIGFSPLGPPGLAVITYSAPPPSLFVFATVPEPNTIVLSALGLIGLAAWGWRRRR